MNKEKLRHLFLFMILGLIWSGCSKKSVEISDTSSAYLIETKAQIKNDGDTNSVTIEIALLPQQAIRMEISATLGVSVATVVMTPTQISYLLHSNKQFYTGPFHEKTLYPVFKKNIDPTILWRVVHDQVPQSAQLKCEVDADKRPLVCRDSEGTLVKWQYLADHRRRIDITSNRFEMRWLFTHQSVMSNYQNETFVLKKPSDYKEIIIR
ncbi:DUF4292 domain-containing protein [Pseudobdellovibrio exovorus]|nr:DUF4292 domain-containing protein [Pseudobdellovibrio exovorus]